MNSRGDKGLPILGPDLAAVTLRIPALGPKRISRRQAILRAQAAPRQGGRASRPTPDPVHLGGEQAESKTATRLILHRNWAGLQ
jgi:hypothetical protein